MKNEHHPQRLQGVAVCNEPLMDSPMSGVIWITSHPSLKTTDMFMIDFFIFNKDKSIAPFMTSNAFCFYISHRFLFITKDENISAN